MANFTPVSAAIGGVLIGLSAAKGIAIYSPEGHPIQVLEMKEQPSNCAFGDADEKSFFITARGLVYRVRLDVKGAGGY